MAHNRKECFEIQIYTYLVIFVHLLRFKQLAVNRQSLLNLANHSL